MNAQEMYGHLCNAFDNLGYKYGKDEENMSIDLGFKGDDLQIPFYIRIIEKKNLIHFQSKLPFTVPEDLRLDMAIAVSYVNNSLVNGTFELDMQKGTMYFRLASSYNNCNIGQEVFSYMLDCTYYTVEQYNDKLFALTKKLMSLEQFVAFVKE